VSVRLLARESHAVIEVLDTGKGMSAEFVRDALFKPFESTKRTGMGIGTYESREYIRELGGRLDVTTAPGRGSRFEIVCRSRNAGGHPKSDCVKEWREQERQGNTARRRRRPWSAEADAMGVRRL
jgi:K+-sensing histidine kinase KdpD